MSLYVIEKWFDSYDKWVHQAERAERLGLTWEQEDKLLGIAYHSLVELDQKAEEMRILYKEEVEKVKQRMKKAVQNDGI